VSRRALRRSSECQWAPTLLHCAAAAPRSAQGLICAVVPLSSRLQGRRLPLGPCGGQKRCRKAAFSPVRKRHRGPPLRTIAAHAKCQTRTPSYSTFRAGRQGCYGVDAVSRGSSSLAVGTTATRWIDVAMDMPAMTLAAWTRCVNAGWEATPCDSRRNDRCYIQAFGFRGICKTRRTGLYCHSARQSVGTVARCRKFLGGRMRTCWNATHARGSN
jgi:hypothetical protein